MRRATDPLGGFRFLLELGALAVAGFSECAGLSVETKVFEYKEGGRNGRPLKFPESSVVGNVTLKRGVATGVMSDALYRWQQDVMSGDFVHVNRRSANPDDPETRKVAVVLLTEAGIPAKRWVLRRAFPVKWNGPDLKAASSEIAIETLELACEGIELETP